jgi:two-component system cell cycle sensor histidine kinase PleC
LAGKRRKAAVAGEPSFAASKSHASSGAFVRIVILAAVVLLGVYTAFGVTRLQRGLANAGRQPAARPRSARILAARLDARVALRSGGLAAGYRTVQSRLQDGPIDAAESVLLRCGRSASPPRRWSRDDSVAGLVRAGRGRGLEGRRAAGPGLRPQPVGRRRPPGDPRRLYIGRVVPWSRRDPDRPRTAPGCRRDSKARGPSAVATADGIAC